MMTSWAEFEAAAPEMTGTIKSLFDAHKHKTIATLRKDGSPRISGIEASIADGELTFGSMPGALKGHDLKRDGRFALHSATQDPPEDDPSAWTGEAKISGRAELVSDPDGKRGYDLFRAVIETASWVSVVDTPEGPRLQIQTWTSDGGLKTTLRE